MDQTNHHVPSKGSIYIVEDERLIAEDLRASLQHHGYQVVGAATSGHEAVQEIQTLRPDVVIMDVRIEGELNGIEVAIIIQSHFDHPVPIIFLTGFSEQAFAYLKVIEHYIYVNKPFKEQELLEAVERGLERSKERNSS